MLICGWIWGIHTLRSMVLRDPAVTILGRDPAVTIPGGTPQSPHPVGPPGYHLQRDPAVTTPGGVLLTCSVPLVESEAGDTRST